MVNVDPRPFPWPFTATYDLRATYTPTTHHTPTPPPLTPEALHPHPHIPTWTHAITRAPAPPLPPLPHDIKLVSARMRDVALCVAAPAVGGCPLFIANRGDSDLSIPAGTLVAGFYSGKWVHIHDGDDSFQPEKDVSFTLESADAPVLLGGIVMTVNEAVERAPNRKVQYHTLEPNPQPGSPGHFELTVKNQVVYRCLDLPAIKTENDPEAGEAAIGLTQAHAASALPPNQWETSLTQIVWTVRYHPAKGLTPVRPQVVLKDALVLKAGEAVKLELV